MICEFVIVTSPWPAMVPNEPGVPFHPPTISSAPARFRLALLKLMWPVDVPVPFANNDSMLGCVLV